jgi:hypothetical protein
MCILNLDFYDPNVFRGKIKWPLSIQASLISIVNCVAVPKCSSFGLLNILRYIAWRILYYFIMYDFPTHSLFTNLLPVDVVLTKVFDNLVLTRIGLAPPHLADLPIYFA